MTGLTIDKLVIRTDSIRQKQEEQSAGLPLIGWCCIQMASDKNRRNRVLVYL